MKTVLLAALGLCEHCGVLLDVEDFPAEAIDAVWSCPKCEKELTQKSFGYEKINGKCQRTRWVGKDGKWTTTEPTADFDLGNLAVVIRPSTPYLF